MPTPRLLDHFTLTAELGRGGFGVVYGGTRKRDGHAVAVKVLLQEPDETTRARLQREAVHLEGLEHPNLPRFHGIFLDPEGRTALVYDQVEGTSMEVRLQQGLPGPERGLRWCRDVAAALQALHERGLVHRDLKPGNLMVGPDDRVTLLDFGLAREFASGDTVTQEGLVIGTPQFMAPELLKGERATPASDIYSFGCLVYLLASGELPFPTSDAGDLIQAHLTRSPPPFPGWAGPARVALEKNPQDRPRQALELIRRLEGGAPSQETIRVLPRAGTRLDPSTPKVAAQRSGMPVGRFLASLILALGVGAGLLSLRPTDEPEEPRLPSEAPASPEARVPRRRLPADFLRLLRPPRSLPRPGLIRTRPVPLADGRAALATGDGHLLVLDPVRGQQQAGPRFFQTDRKEGFRVQLLPRAGGGVWAVVLEDMDAPVRLLEFPDPLGPGTPAPDLDPRPGSEVHFAQPLGEGLWAAAVAGPEATPEAPGTLWVSRDGARPVPHPLPALKHQRRICAAAPLAGGGAVLQVGDLGARGEPGSSTLVGLDPAMETSWWMEISQGGLQESRITVAPEGLYVMWRDRLHLLELDGLAGEVPLERLRPLGEKLPGLGHFAPSRPTGVLLRSRQGVELWTLPPLPPFFQGKPVLEWLRFPAEPGAVPAGLGARQTLRLGPQLVFQDTTCGVKAALPTGAPDQVVVASQIAKSQSHVQVMDLARGEVLETFAMDDPETGETMALDGPPALLDMPGTPGQWLLLPTFVNPLTGGVMELYLPPD